MFVKKLHIIIYFDIFSKSNYQHKPAVKYQTAGLAGAEIRAGFIEIAGPAKIFGDGSRAPLDAVGYQASR